MPAAIPGAKTAAPGRLRDAAAVILTRDEAPDIEALWVRRGRQLRFSAGYWAFPGGSLDRSDREIAVEGAEGEPAALIAAAARELFEETGVFIARSPQGADPIRLRAQRRDLLAGKLSFAAILATARARLSAEDFVPSGRWITPGFSPIRFDCRFFLARLPEGQTAEIWPGELAEGGFVKPAEALARWSRAEAFLQPPILNAMKALAGPPEKLLGRLREPPFVEGCVGERIELQRGIFVFPVPSQTLPPARHTGCYLVGDRELLLIDPGCHEPEEQQRLARFASRLAEQEGRRIRAIVLTHDHVDHCAGAAALSAALRAPIWAHAETAARVPGVERRLEDGERLRLEGDPGIELEVIHTPGHARGHLCLFEPRTRALICGDMVSTGSTVLVDPPEGDMGDFVASLQRISRLAPSALFPGHGEPILDAPAKLAEQLAHRAWREGRILGALTDRPQPLEAITRAAYDDLTDTVLPLARRSALAILEKLCHERRARAEGGLYAIDTQGNRDARS
jgi:glyoxylase-like metal-dependent hydrolase (beta-lactamase superfamily II)/8-oxo-dGTP pyrophosphatase MutT (NUDIX family)